MRGDNITIDELFGEVVGYCYYCKAPVYKSEDHFAFTKKKTKKGFILSDFTHTKCYQDDMSRVIELMRR